MSECVSECVCVSELFSSLGYGGGENLGSVLSEIFPEQLCQFQQGRTRGERHTLHQTLLVEDEEVSGTGEDSPAPFTGPEDTAPRLHVRDKVFNQL